MDPPQEKKIERATVAKPSEIIRDTMHHAQQSHHPHPSIRHEYSYEHHHYYPHHAAVTGNYYYDDYPYRYRKIYAPSPFLLGDNSVNSFFMGSVTVMGLFLLYRMMEKVK